MKKFMNHVVLSCKKATALVEKKSFTKLSPTEKLQLWVHTSMCNGCSAYQKQSVMIDRLLKRHFADNECNAPAIENPELKGRIISNLNDDKK